MQYMLGVMLYVLLVGPTTYSLLKTAAQADAALLEQGALREYRPRRVGARRPVLVSVPHPIHDVDLNAPDRRN